MQRVSSLSSVPEGVQEERCEDGDVNTAMPACTGDGRHVCLASIPTSYLLCYQAWPGGSGRVGGDGEEVRVLRGYGRTTQRS